MKRVEKILANDATNSPWRADFPGLNITMNGQPLAFLDSAASAQKPYTVINAMNAVYEDGYANVHRGLYRLSQDLTTQFEAVRANVSDFIGAGHPDSIIFTKNATEGINLVAQSWGRAHLNAGDEILLSAMEHHANIVPWQMIAAEKGCVIKVLPLTPEGKFDLAVLPDLMTLKTKMIAVTQVSNVLGTVNNIQALIHRVRSYRPDIAVLVDGSQAVVHGPVNVREMDADFYVFTGHKIYGPTGVGVLYGRPQILATMPPYQGGGDMIDRVSFSGTTFREAPHKFEAGTPAIAEVIGLGAAIDYVRTIGFPRITAHEEILATELALVLDGIPGLRVYGPRLDRAGIFSFTADWGHASDIAMILDKCGVAVRAGHHCAMPLMDVLGVQATVRASLALYNNSSDIMALAKGLKKAREMLS